MMAIYTMKVTYEIVANSEEQAREELWKMTAGNLFPHRKVDVEFLSVEDLPVSETI